MCQDGLVVYGSSSQPFNLFIKWHLLTTVPCYLGLRAVYNNLGPKPIFPFLDSAEVAFEHEQNAPPQSLSNSENGI